MPEMGVVLSDSVRGPKQTQPVLTPDAIRRCQELSKLVRELVPKLGFARLESVRRRWDTESRLTPVLNLFHEHATIVPHRLPGRSVTASKQTRKKTSGFAR